MGARLQPIYEVGTKRLKIIWVFGAERQRGIRFRHYITSTGQNASAITRRDTEPKLQR